MRTSPLATRPTAPSGSSTAHGWAEREQVRRRPTRHRGKPAVRARILPAWTADPWPPRTHCVGTGPEPRVDVLLGLRDRDAGLLLRFRTGDRDVEALVGVLNQGRPESRRRRSIRGPCVRPRTFARVGIGTISGHAGRSDSTCTSGPGPSRPPRPGRRRRRARGRGVEHVGPSWRANGPRLDGPLGQPAGDGTRLA